MKGKRNCQKNQENKKANAESQLTSEKLPGKEAIDDKLKRINLKSKRKRTLLKKIIEMSQMCKLEMLLIIHDAEMNKIIEYNSGS